MQIRWADIQNAADGGVFEVGGRQVSISPEHIRIWQRHPDAVFDVIELKGPAGLSSYSLDIQPVSVDLGEDDHLE